MAAIPVLWLGYKPPPRSQIAASSGERMFAVDDSASRTMDGVKKFSAECVKAIVQNEVDGDTLLRLESAHLSAMGISKMKDRILLSDLCSRCA